LFFTVQPLMTRTVSHPDEWLRPPTRQLLIACRSFII